MRRAMGGHPMEDRRCRRHRILREELHACGERTKTNRFVPGHQILGLVRIRQSEVQGTAHLADRVSPEFRGLKLDRKSTRLNSSHLVISYAVFCLKKKKRNESLTTLL